MTINRYTEIQVLTKTNGVRTIFRGDNLKQAYSACCNHRVGRDKSGIRRFNGLRARIVDSVTSMQRPKGWLLKEGEKLC